ncbi:hypothetical protein DL93DRAFT_2092026 [Clavulina sp. PMI_390]|nr:hypothetical protein DL93DRAFT_2092026 [Clavulina sp. PMI_390]
MSTLNTGVPMLTTANYALWEPSMEDYLHAKGFWYWIHNPAPDPVSDAKGHRRAVIDKDQALGEIRRHIVPELRSVATSSSDPKEVLSKLKETYGKASYATRFNALQTLMNTRQESSEPVATFIARACEGLRHLQSTCPAPAVALVSSTGYGLAEADMELLISVLLNGTTFTALTSSLLAQSDLTVQKVEDALKNEEAHRLGTAAAAAIASPASAAPAILSSSCSFCGRTGHVLEQCFKYKDAMQKAQAEVKENSKRKRGKGKGKANAAQDESKSESSAPAMESAAAAGGPLPI